MTVSRIDRLAVKNFQSLDAADIELGAFTVIVGPSSSGKSALLRALRAVVRNVTAPSAVRVGQTMFTCEIGFGDTRVSIERGKSHSTYRAVLPGGAEEVFTKAGRTVPDEIQKILGLPLPEGPDLTFSSQIDPPFLLSETGTTAAKMLGDLTNVSKLHAMSREANRRRLDSSKMQKIRLDDAVGCAQRLRSEFGDLQAHAAQVKAARALMTEVHDSAREVERLSATISQIEMVEAAEKEISAHLATLPQPEDIGSLADYAAALITQRKAVIKTISDLAALAEAEVQLAAASSTLKTEIFDLDQEYRAVLKEAGTCPTCGGLT